MAAIFGGGFKHFTKLLRKIKLTVLSGCFYAVGNLRDSYGFGDVFYVFFCLACRLDARRFFWQFIHVEPP